MNRLLKSQVASLNVQKAYVVKKLLDIIESSLSDDHQNTSEQQQNLDNSAFASGSTSKSEGNTTRNSKDLSLALKAIENLCKQLNYSSQDCDPSSSSFSFNSFHSPDINIIDNLDQQKI